MRALAAAVIALATFSAGCLSEQDAERDDEGRLLATHEWSTCGLCPPSHPDAYRNPILRTAAVYSDGSALLVSYNEEPGRERVRVREGVAHDRSTLERLLLPQLDGVTAVVADVERVSLSNATYSSFVTTLNESWRDEPALGECCFTDAERIIYARIHDDGRRVEVETSGRGVAEDSPFADVTREWWDLERQLGWR